MSARPISSATVSFGLVSIPVKIYSAGESAAGITFNMLHRKCGSRLKQQYVCPQDGEIVERTEMVKGYEFTKGQYVLFSDEEIKALQEKATQTVEIAEFIPATSIDPVYFDKSYYLGPDRGGDRAYRLLAAALEKSGRTALARYAARGKQYLVMVRPAGGTLVMQQLRYADEVRPASEVPIGEGEVKDAEMKLALAIVEQGATEKFRPESYEDDVRKRMLVAIEKKVEGREIAEEPAEEPKAQVIDLMEALKASLKGRQLEDRRPAQRAEKAAAEETEKARPAARRGSKRQSR